MKKQFIALCFSCVTIITTAQDKPSIKKLLNYVVGGTWVSTNTGNDGKPESYKSFHMNFSNWGSDDESVTGTIFGIKNTGDTTQLIEVWNFIDQSTNTIFYVNKTMWGWIGTGSIKPYDEKHLDIQFETTTAEGKKFLTRDLHYIDDENHMRAETYHKAKEEDDWQKASSSEWVRK